MGKRPSAADVLELSISERIQFLEDVWDSIANVPEEVHLAEEQKKNWTEDSRPTVGIQMQGCRGAKLNELEDLKGQFCGEI